MTALSTAERLALRNLTTLRAAQSTYDNAAEPLMPESTAELTEWAEKLTAMAEDILDTIGRAERCMRDGNDDAARDLLTTAARALGDME